MTQSKQRFCLALAASVLSALASSSARAQSATAIEIEIGAGSHAGSYKLPEANTICMHVKSRNHFSAAYKDVAATDAKTVSGAGFNVFNPDDPASRRGEINIRFGDPGDKRPAAIELQIPAGQPGPLTLTRSGTAATLTFRGRTKDGVALQVTARCASVEEF